MSNKATLKPIAVALGATFAVTLIAGQPVNAADNPFSMTELSNGGYMLATNHEWRCGEGVCGGSKMDKKDKMENTMDHCQMMMMMGMDEMENMEMGESEMAKMEDMMDEMDMMEEMDGMMMMERCMGLMKDGMKMNMKKGGEGKCGEGKCGEGKCGNGDA
ncbi:MAG: hypothetical protein OXS28_15330 [Gammaproteobacteria bacterium]|nr:hypothetical protein [Gammaproteobacteria bacterium]